MTCLLCCLRSMLSGQAFSILCRDRMSLVFSGVHVPRLGLLMSFCRQEVWLVSLACCRDLGSGWLKIFVLFLFVFCSCLLD